jgi:hypothetical protein
MSFEERVLFKPSGEFTAQRITMVNEKFIYLIKLDDCPRYISIDPNIEYIGLVNNDKFHVFKLTDGEIPEEFQSQFTYIDEAKINFLTFKVVPDNWSELRREDESFFGSIPNFLYICYRDHALKCVEFRNLDTAKAIINDLNVDLHHTCPGFTLNVDYVFSFPNPSNVSSFTLVQSEHELPEYANMLILCLFKDNNCISSLEIELNEDYVSFNSKTDDPYEGRKFNKLLRAVIIIIAKAIDPELLRVHSYAVSSTSAYLMLRYFNAVHIPESREQIFNKNTSFKTIETAMDNNTHDTISTEVELNDKNIQNAISVFNLTTFQINCGPLIAVAKGHKTRRHKTRRHKTRHSIKSKIYNSNTY